MGSIGVRVVTIMTVIMLAARAMAMGSLGVGRVAMPIRAVRRMIMMVVMRLTGLSMPAAAARVVAMPFMGLEFRLRIHGNTGH
ncbi:hypothetical protein [Chelatococcus asaccharovorans]|uniref:hypothetical protein n=1 Tax=Chelatococcus asaccharovorans TaxID=28210 RepID=UPI00224C7B8C|nr:hypothetical protein [Chelatococcus asaccharovorans]CAH1685913.1 conserved hypothetical protein [Chelatococcus asaccharovorans]